VLPEDELDYGTGDGPAYGGGDGDVPVYIPHDEMGAHPVGHDLTSAVSSDNTIRRTRRIPRAFVLKGFANAGAWNAIGSIAVAITTIFYTIYAHRQWIAMSGQIAVMRQANDLTGKALAGSDSSLQKTLTKMQGQIDAADKLYVESKKQTGELSKQAAAASTAAVNSGLQTDEFKQQTAILKEQLEVSQRPFVYSTPKLASGLSYDSNGANLALDVTSFNGGLTPASKVAIYAKLYRPTFDKAVQKSEETQVCSQAKMSDLGNTSLFHEDKHVKKLRIRYSLQDISRNAVHNFFSMDVALCTVYEGTLPTTQQYSSFHIYSIQRIDLEHPGAFAFWAGQDVPEDRVVLGNIDDTETIID
jgi:hypothetical protein